MGARPVTVGLTSCSYGVVDEFVRFVADHVAAVSSQLVLHSQEAFDLDLDVLVVADTSRLANEALLSSLLSRGVGLVGLVESHTGRAKLQRLGVDVVLGTDVSVEELLAAVRRAEPPDHTVLRSLAAEVDGHPETGEGYRVAVGGARGAGATECTIGMAATAARWVLGLMVVDCDERRPGMARRLALAPEPNVGTLIERFNAAGDGVGDPVLTALADPVNGTKERLPFSVIAGLSSPGAWATVGAEDARRVLNAVARRAPLVLANVGGDLEDLARYGVDRCPLSKAAIQSADRLVAVCDASPLGLLACLEWLGDLRQISGPQPVEVIFNRCPKDTGLRRELEAELADATGGWAHPAATVPMDRRVPAAGWNGDLVTRGPFRRAIEDLTGRVLAALSSGATRGVEVGP